MSPSSTFSSETYGSVRWRTPWPLLLAVGLLVTAEGVSRLAVPFADSRGSRVFKLDGISASRSRPWDRVDGVEYLEAPHVDVRYEFYDSEIPGESVAYRTNALGFREDEIEEKQPGTVRIACVGDSHAFALRASHDDRWTRALERELTALTGTPHEVLNFGVMGAGPVQYAEVIERQILGIDPDRVLMLFTTGDAREMVLEPATQHRHREAIFPYQTEGQRRRGEETIDAFYAGPRVAMLTHSMFLRFVTHVRRRPKTIYMGGVDLELEHDSEESTLQRTLTTMQGVERGLEKAGVPLTLVIYRPDGWHRHPARSLLRQFLSVYHPAAQTQLIDTEGQWDPTEDMRPLGDWHVNDEGNRAFAAWLARQMVPR